MGDIARAVSAPSTALAPRRASRPPAACNPNRWDRTGTPAAAAAKSAACNREGPPSRAGAPQKQLFHFPLQLRERRLERLRSRIDDHFALRTQLVEPEAHCLPDPSLDP